LIFFALKKVKWFFQFNSFWLFNNFNRNEDLFWSWGVPRQISWFRIPPFDIAFKFSFEKFPKHLFLLNKHQLPFGCHAWEKYDPDFWKEYVLEMI
jgi:hypothetical protein